jgi:hypothetical protein
LVQRLKALALGGDHALAPRGTAIRLRLAQAARHPALATQAPVTRHPAQDHDPRHILAFASGQPAVMVSHSGVDPFGEMNLIS